MSRVNHYDIMAAARRYKAGGCGAKATLLAVVESMGKHDDEWSCWPGDPTLADITEQSVASVRRHIKSFVAAGLLRREARWRRSQSGGRETDSLVLDVDVLMGVSAHGAHKAAGVSEQPSDGKCASDEGGKCAQSVDARSIEHLQEQQLERVDEIVDALCAHLAQRVAEHSKSGTPVVSKSWRTSMSLLLRRGAPNVEPSSVEPERVLRAIDYVFTYLAEPDGRGFCWADQVRSAAALRRHWTALQIAARRHNEQRHGVGGRVVARAVEQPSSFAAMLDDMKRTARAVDATSAVDTRERGSSDE